jgi:hypothetical protein
VRTVLAILCLFTEARSAATRDCFLRLWQKFHNRKNSLFIGNPRGSWTMAAVRSNVTSTCRRRNIHPQPFLTSLLTHLSRFAEATSRNAASRPVETVSGGTAPVRQDQQLMGNGLHGLPIGVWNKCLCWDVLV